MCRSPAISIRHAAWLLLSASWLLVAAPDASWAATITVGTDAVNCDFTNLQTAIAAADSGDVLQLEDTTFTGQSGVNFNVSSKSLQLLGGFLPGCDGSRGGQFAKTTLMGLGADSVVEFSGTGSRFAVLERLLVTGGNDDFDYGGGIEVSGDFDVTLLTVRITGNESERGGGIHLDGSQGATLFVGDSSVIDDNFASRFDSGDPKSGAGAGIFCESGGIVRLNNPVTLEFNAAGGDGGAIYADDCQVLMPHDEVGFIAYDFQDNTARHGGGFYFTGGTTATLDGSPTWAAEVDDNYAGTEGGGGFGGGIYLAGAGTRLETTYTVIGGNFATQGGGIFVTDGAEFRLGREPGSMGGHGGGIFSNRAVIGAAVVAQTSGVAEIAETFVFNNEVTEDSGSGAIGYVANGGILDFDNSLISSNHPATGTGNSAILSLGGTVWIIDSTVVFNYNHDYVVGGNGELRVENSILWDNVVLDVFAPAFLPDDLHCAILDPGSTVPVGATEVSFADPQFLEYPFRATVAPTSPAIDLCTNTTSNSYDIHGDPRPSGVRQDAGADEYVPPFFADGFESGDTSAWSQATGALHASPAG